MPQIQTFGKKSFFFVKLVTVFNVFFIKTVHDEARNVNINYQLFDS